MIHKTCKAVDRMERFKPRRTPDASKGNFPKAHVRMDIPKDHTSELALYGCGGSTGTTHKERKRIVVKRDHGHRTGHSHKTRDYPTKPPPQNKRGDNIAHTSPAMRSGDMYVRVPTKV